MSSSQTVSEAIQEVNKLRQAERAQQRITRFGALVEINHDTKLVMVYGGKKARAAGLMTIMRVAMPVKSPPIPMPETLARLGGLDIVIRPREARYVCRWLPSLVKFDHPHEPWEEALKRMAHYMIVGLREEEERDLRKKWRRLAASVDYEHEWKIEKRAMQEEVRALQSKRSLRIRKERAESQSKRSNHPVAKAKATKKKRKGKKARRR